MSNTDHELILLVRIILPIIIVKLFKFTGTNELIEESRKQFNRMRDDVDPPLVVKVAVKKWA